MEQRRPARHAQCRALLLVVMLVPVVGHDNASHGVQDHLEHTAWSQSGANDVGHRLGCLNVGQLRLAARLALGVGVQHHHRALHDGDCE